MPHNEKMYWRADEETFGYSTKDYKAVIRESMRMNHKKMENMVLQGKLKMLEAQNEQLRSEKEDMRKNIEKYAMPLSKDVPLYSDNMGRRHMRRLIRNERYESLNGIVKDLYIRSRNLKDYKDLYELMQNVKCENKTDWNKKAFDELEEQCGGIKENWEISLHSSSGYWHQIDIGDRKHSSNMRISQKNRKRLYSGSRPNRQVKQDKVWNIFMSCQIWLFSMRG